MALRIACVNESVFQVCLEHKVWGANNNYPNKWNIGDYLVFKVDDHFRALAQIAGEVYVEEEPLWDNGYFWCRVPLSFIKDFGPEKTISFFPIFRQLFIDAYGRHYGTVFLNKTPVLPEIELEILKAFSL